MIKLKRPRQATRIDSYSIVNVLVYSGQPSYLLRNTDGTELGRYHTYLEAEQALTEHRFWQATGKGSTP